MPTHRYQVRLQGISGFPQDVYENVLYFDTTALDNVEGTCDGISEAYDAMSVLAGWSGLEVRVYELAGGQPIFQKEYPNVQATGASGPGEVALCLSYATVDDPEASTGRRRGRIYLGPLTSGQVSAPRPGPALIEEVLDLGEALASIGFASATTWHMFSKTDNQSIKIESIWCDNAWDTQRRRGLDPTVRTTRDVQ
jgi:hypothetical protein